MFPEANGKNSGLKNEEDQHNMASILSHLVSNKMSILALNYTFLGQNRLKLKFECKRKSSFIKQQLCIKLVQLKFCQNRRMNIIDAISVNSSIFFIALLSHSGLKG